PPRIVPNAVDSGDLHFVTLTSSSEENPVEHIESRVATADSVFFAVLTPYLENVVELRCVWGVCSIQGFGMLLQYIFIFADAIEDHEPCLVELFLGVCQQVLVFVGQVDCKRFLEIWDIKLS